MDSLQEFDIEWNKLLIGLRSLQGFTQEELGKKLGFSRTQLLYYENGAIKPQIRNRNKILNYLHGHNFVVNNLLDTSLKVSYLDKDCLWGDLIDGIQTINGWNNQELSKLLNLDKTTLESWKVKKSIPHIKTKSRILELVKNKNVNDIIKYSKLDWSNLALNLINKLNISPTLMSKLFSIYMPKNKDFKPNFKVRKRILELIDLVKNESDIRDIIFSVRRKKLMENKKLYLKYIRIYLGLSQEKLISLVPVIHVSKYARFELGYNKLSESKVNLIENKLSELCKKQNLDFDRIKQEYTLKVKEFEISELQQWNERKNIHEIIGFRTTHPRERVYLDTLSDILQKQGFLIFKNVILADKGLNTYDVDICAYKICNNKIVRICFEVRDRKGRYSTCMTFLQNMNRLNLIREKFNFDYSILLVPKLSQERSRYSYNNLILFDDNDIIKLRECDIIDVITEKIKSPSSSITTVKDFKDYLRKNKLTLRDVSAVTNITPSGINKWKTDYDLIRHRLEVDRLVYLVKTRGIAFIKFQRYKKIYTNPSFLAVKAIKSFLYLNEKKFKQYFGLKPSDLINKALNDSCFLSINLLNNIKNYLTRRNYQWNELLQYIQIYIDKKFKRWNKLETYNKEMGWKFIKFLDNNSNKQSKILEAKVAKFLSKKYKHIIKNIQIFIQQTNQVREVDLIGFNAPNDIIIVECKLSTPGYGYKILLDDLGTIKAAINAKHCWFVTSESDLNSEFNRVINDKNGRFNS